MSDVVVFALVMGGLFVVRFCVATAFAFLFFAKSDRCPYCDLPTLRLERRGLVRILPWFRRSWCPECNWEGLLREGGEPTPYPRTQTSSQPGQLPVISKKSSK